MAALANTTSLAPTPAWSWAASDGVTVGDVVVGDLDGDQFDDVVLSGLGPAGPADVGISIFHGGVDGLSPTPGLQWVVPLDPLVTDGGPAEVQLALADVTGDGFDDVVVGVPGPADAEGDGRIEIYTGWEWGIGAAPTFVVPGPLDAGARAGLELVAAGDLDLDGFEDVLVGQDDAERPTWEVYRGSAYGLVPAGWTTTGTLVLAADLTGDGHGDIVRADLQDGVVELFEGSGGGPGTEPTWTLDQPAIALSAVDATGDQVLDLAIYLAPADDQATDTEVQWFSFSAGDPGATPAVTQPAPAAGRVDGLGDIDLDGYGDWAITDDQFHTSLVLGAAPDLEENAFQAWSTLYKAGSSSGRVAAGRFDADDCLDVVVHIDATWAAIDAYGAPFDDLDSVVGAWSCPLVADTTPPTTDTGGTPQTTTPPTTSPGGSDSFPTDRGGQPKDQAGVCGCVAGASGGGWTAILVGALFAARRARTARSG